MALNGIGSARLASSAANGEPPSRAYLEARVSDAVRPFEGQLSEERLELVRRTLREALETEPVLRELLRRITGSAPPAPAETSDP